MADLARLLNPRSIAVIGGAPAAAVVRQCQKLGYTGEIWPVHPKKSDMHGVECFPTIADLPGVPDAAFIAVNRHLTIDAVEQLSALGAGGAVCYASGFSESGEVELQARLVEVAGPMALLGPNCYGYVNALDGVALWPDEHGCSRVDRGVGIISQSGNVGLNLTLQQRGLKMAYMVTVGNQAGGGVEDALDSFVADDRVTAIGMFIEAIRDPRRFAQIAIAAAKKGKRIVALQTGKSEAGALIAASHTASLAGNRAAYAALFARCGVATVETPTELVETLKVLDHGGVLSGYKMASLSCSGGEASLVADLSETTSLTFAPFPADQRARIEATPTELVSVANPFDYHTFMWGDREAMATTFTAVMDGPQDATMLVLDAPPSPDNDPSSWYVAADALGDAARSTGRRGVVVATLAECLNEPFRQHIAQQGLTPLLGLSEALTALEAAATVGTSVGATPHSPVTAPGSTRLVDEASAKQRLGALGVPVPNGTVVDRGRVLVAAEEIGYPVTLKALGHAHKSEAGAVKVGLRDAASLQAALDAMPSTDAGFLVEATVTDVVAEVLVTVRRDAPVGWLVTLGHGGVTTELWGDVTHLLAPVTVEQVQTALSRLRSARLLTGFRGRPAADATALAELVVRLTDAVVGTDVVEVELNPVLVGASGATAVDALLIVED